jgi:CRISPR-associated exonuclease Cas4
MIADQSNSYLDIGRFISEETFSRERKEIYIPDLSAKFDMLTKRNGQFFVAEIKKSSATMKSGIEQLKYYMYLLRTKGIEIKGLIKIPTERKSLEVILTNLDINFIEENLKNLKILSCEEFPPPAIKIKYCQKCAHYEFCFC